jgi:hypothetical protein
MAKAKNLQELAGRWDAERRHARVSAFDVHLADKRLHQRLRRRPLRDGLVEGVGGVAEEAWLDGAASDPSQGQTGH